MTRAALLLAIVAVGCAYGCGPKPQKFVRKFGSAECTAWKADGEAGLVCVDGK